MAIDKVIDSAQIDAAMTATANAIRAKNGTTAQIQWKQTNGFADAVGEAEKYEGAYSVVSKISTEQVLPTKGKQMVENMTVLKVPQVEVANASGGNTLIIGDDYYA